MISIYMTQGTQIPPYEVIVPWNLVINTYIDFIILSILSFILSAYYMTKQDISNSFMVDS